MVRQSAGVPKRQVTYELTLEERNFVETSLKAQREMGKLDNKFKDVSKSAKQSTKDINDHKKALETFKTTMKDIATIIGTTLVAAYTSYTQAISEANAKNIEFQKNFGKLATLGNNLNNIPDLKKKIAMMSTMSGVPANIVSDTMFNVQSTAKNLSPAQQERTTTLSLAQNAVAGTDPVSLSSAIQQLLSGFNGSVKSPDSALLGLKTASGFGQRDVSDFAKNVPTIIQPFTQRGFKMEEALGALSLVDQDLKSLEESSTSLVGLMNNLSKAYKGGITDPTKSFVDQMKDLSSLSYDQISEMFGESGSKSVRSLVKQTELLNKNINQTAKDMRDVTKLYDELEGRMKDPAFANQLLFKNMEQRVENFGMISGLEANASSVAAKNKQREFGGLNAAYNVFGDIGYNIEKATGGLAKIAGFTDFLTKFSDKAIELVMPKFAEKPLQNTLNSPMRGLNWLQGRQYGKNNEYMTIIEQKMLNEQKMKTKYEQMLFEKEENKIAGEKIKEEQRNIFVSKTRQKSNYSENPYDYKKTNTTTFNLTSILKPGLDYLNEKLKETGYDTERLRNPITRLADSMNTLNAVAENKAKLDAAELKIKQEQTSKLLSDYYQNSEYGKNSKARNLNFIQPWEMNAESYLERSKKGGVGGYGEYYNSQMNGQAKEQDRAPGYYFDNKKSYGFNTKYNGAGTPVVHIQYATFTDPTQMMQTINRSKIAQSGL